MSVSITLWSGFSKRRNSTKVPSSTGTSVSVLIKNGTSKESPTFILDASSIGSDWNYCSAFGHYYYIEDIVYSTNDIIELSCVQDVLATYKSDIGNYTAFIERSASASDNQIRNSFISSRQTLGSTRKASTAITGYSILGSYVLRVQGRSGIDTYAGTSAGINNAFASIFDLDTFSSEYEDIDTAEIVSGIEQYRKILFATSFNPSNYIASLMWFPFTIGGGSTSNLYLGFHDAGAVSGLTKTAQYSILDSGTITRPTRVFNDWRDYDNTWCRYTLYLPGVGEIALDASSISNGLKYDMSVDLYTGAVTYIITDTNGAHISTLAGNLGVSQQIGFASPVSATMQAIASQIASSGDGDIKTSTTHGVHGGGGGKIGDTPQPNRYAAAEFISQLNTPIANAIKGTAEKLGSAVTNLTSNALDFLSTLPKYNSNTSVIGMPGNKTALVQYPDIVVSVQSYTAKDDPNDYIGSPYYKVAKINTLSGYVKCSGASISLDGLASDASDVNAYLNTGFYYE